jgi:hypothetical protein
MHAVGDQGPPLVWSAASIFNSSPSGLDVRLCVLSWWTPWAISVTAWQAEEVVNTPCIHCLTFHAYQEPSRGRQGYSGKAHKGSLPNMPLCNWPLPLLSWDPWLNVTRRQPLNVGCQSSCMFPSACVTTWPDCGIGVQVGTQSSLKVHLGPHVSFG